MNITHKKPVCTVTTKSSLLKMSIKIWKELPGLGKTAKLCREDDDHGYICTTEDTGNGIETTIQFVRFYDEVIVSWITLPGTELLNENLNKILIVGDRCFVVTYDGVYILTEGHCKEKSVLFDSVQQEIMRRLIPDRIKINYSGKVMSIYNQGITLTESTKKGSKRRCVESNESESEFLKKVGEETFFIFWLDLAGPATVSVICKSDLMQEGNPFLNIEDFNIHFASQNNSIVYFINKTFNCKTFVCKPGQGTKAILGKSPKMTLQTTFVSKYGHLVAYTVFYNSPYTRTLTVYNPDGSVALNETYEGKNIIMENIDYFRNLYRGHNSFCIKDGPKVLQNYIFTPPF